MNVLKKTDMKKLADLAKQVEAVQSALVDLAAEYLERFENLSEKVQEGEKGEVIMSVAEELETAADEAGRLGDMLSYLGVAQ